MKREQREKPTEGERHHGRARERETEREIAEREITQMNPVTIGDPIFVGSSLVEPEHLTDPDPSSSEQRRDFRWIVGRLS
jgi:hypothetical protein